jgi:biopolymer transport protein ExbB/TolQ
VQPEDTLVELRRYQRRWLIIGVIAVAASPLVWVGAAVLGMFASFQTIATTANPTPDELAPGIYLSILGPLTGGVVALAGAALIIWSLRRKRRLDEIESELRNLAAG